MKRHDYEGLLEFCTTEHQSQICRAMSEGMKAGDIAQVVGLAGERAVYKVLETIKKHAASKGFSPEIGLHHPAPNGLGYKGGSVLRDADGNVVMRWDKYHRDTAENLLNEMFEGFKETLPKASPVNLKLKKLDPNLLNLVILTDYHLGALAWDEETRGENWDLEIAEKLLIDFFTAVVKRAPPAHTAIFAQMGDAIHYDGLEAITPTAKNILDTDTRFTKLVRVAIKVFRHVIKLLLERHEHVYVIMAEGNHDIASSVWLREFMATFYEDEPRVTVDTSPDPYYAFEWGNTSLFFHHGHLRRSARGKNSVDQVFVNKFREVFGRTRFSYGHLGHLHFDESVETMLMTTERHRTLAAPDAYASRMGYGSGRDGKVIQYHKKYGHVGRLVLNPDMIKDVVNG